MSQDNQLAPLVLFRFHVDFNVAPLKDAEADAVPLCSGSFAECSGLEATMEPKVINEGGLNYGAHQRVGKTTFATVILKRGITTTPHAWQWFELVNRNSGYAYRMSATVNVYTQSGEPAWVWKLERAVPVKFKFGDLNARATEVGVEELHLAHEGLSMLPAAQATRGRL